MQYNANKPTKSMLFDNIFITLLEYHYANIRNSRLYFFLLCPYFDYYSIHYSNDSINIIFKGSFIIGKNTIYLFKLVTSSPSPNPPSLYDILYHAHTMFVHPLSSSIQFYNYSKKLRPTYKRGRSQ